MTCRIVRDLIDAGPFVEFAPRQLEAAERHLRTCTECRDVRLAAHVLEAALPRLPEPSPPVGFADAVMRRAVHAEEARTDVSRGAVPIAPARIAHERLAWAAAVAGVAIGIGIQAYAWVAGEAALMVGWRPFDAGVAGLAWVPPGGPTLVVLALGVVILLAGLFASVDSRVELETGVPESRSL